jgi:hypothetical protein
MKSVILLAAVLVLSSFAQAFDSIEVNSKQRACR